MSAKNFKGVTFIRIEGPADAASAARMEEVLSSAGNIDSHVVVDMSKSEFIGWPVLSRLLGFAGYLERRNRKFRICSPPGEVRDALEVIGAGEMIRITQDATGALMTIPGASEKNNVSDRRSGQDRRTSNIPFEGCDRRRLKRRSSVA